MQIVIDTLTEKKYETERVENSCLHYGNVVTTSSTGGEILARWGEYSTHPSKGNPCQCCQARTMSSTDMFACTDFAKFDTFTLEWNKWLCITYTVVLFRTELSTSLQYILL